VSLQPGRGNFYLVRLEAFADPTPPQFGAAELDLDPGEEIGRLLKLMEHMSEQELMDQVHRRMTLHLCGACYRDWIEDPVG
jgi:hypothetical protein